jgi:hypothetical protein
VHRGAAASNRILFAQRPLLVLRISDPQHQSCGRRSFRVIFALG